MVNGYKCFKNADTTVEKDGITILTGANDSGKSTFLSAIHLFFNLSQSIDDDEVCTYAKRGEVPSVEIEFEMLRTNELVPVTSVTVGQKVVVRRALTPGRAGDKYEFRWDNAWRDLKPNHAERMFPQLLTLSPEAFQKGYSRSEPRTPTSELLGRKFGFTKAAGTVRQHTLQANAKRIVSSWLTSNWKANKKADFDFVSTTQGNIAYVMRDELDEFRALHLFGRGFQHFATNTIQLESFKEEIEQTKDKEGLVLIDEPELSLHPRAQRHYLDPLRRLPQDFQVVFATHSPSMIDQSEPQRVRVLVKDVNEKDVRILHKATRKNYEAVRLALGILPSDSLLFGRLNLIVEGAIEFLCLPTLSNLLKTAGRTHLDFSQVSLINGQGREVPRMFKLAVATNQPTVAIVDNDDAGRRYEREILEYTRQNHLNMPCVPVKRWEMPGSGDSEFEDLLPSSKYVETVNNICKPATPLSETSLVNADRARTSTIEELLKKQGINFDEYKTEVGIAVVSKMTPPECAVFETVFTELSKILQAAESIFDTDPKLR